MAEAIADSGRLAHEDDINLLEIDFDDAAGAAATNDSTSAGITQDDEAHADEFDFQVNEFEVVDDNDTGEQAGDGGAPSGDFTQTELAVPQGNTAESEIGYEDEEPLEAETAGHEFEATGEEQDTQDDSNVDEIDYDDGDLEVVHEDNLATEVQAAMQPAVQVEAVTTGVSVDRALEDPAADAESHPNHTEADDGSAHKSSEAGQQERVDDSVDQARDYPADTATAAPAGEVSNVTVLYNGVKYELCASVHNDDPETYFFAGQENLDAPLWQFFGRLRDVIKDEIEPSDDLVIKVPQLKLEFGEVCHADGNIPRDPGADLLQGTSNDFLDKRTFRDILNLYRRFKYNDGLEDSEQPQLVIHLVAKPNCEERFAMLTEAADAGRGWSEFFDNSDGSDLSSSRHSASGQEFDGDQTEIFGDEQMEGIGDNDMQHDVVEVIEEAYFYDDTNDAGDEDAEHMFDGQDAEVLGHNGDDIQDPNESYELAGELVENDEPNQGPDRIDGYMGSDDDAARQMDVGEDENGPMRHANTGDEDTSNPTGAAPEGASGFGGGSELESFDEAGSALEASSALASGNIPFPFRISSERASPVRQEQQEWLDDFMERDPEHTTPEMWKTFDSLPRPSTPFQPSAAGAGDEDLIDYSDDEDSFEQPAIQYTRRFSPPPHFPRRAGKSILDVPTLSDLKHRPEEEPDDEADDEPDEGPFGHEKGVSIRAMAVGTEGNIIPSIELDDNDVFTDAEGEVDVASQTWFKGVRPGSPSPGSLARGTASPVKPSSIARRPVCMYRATGTSKRSEASRPARSSISPGQAALMMEPQNSAESAYAFSSNHSSRAHFGLASGSGFHLSEHNGANLSDLQVQQESTFEPNETLETADVSTPHDDLEHGDGGNSADNDESFDMEGFTAYDEAPNDEPLVEDSHIQVIDSHNTSATSTVDGDEITYEDESVALADTGHGTHEAGDEAAGNGDEIDWENDGTENVPVAEDPTNVPSPASLSIKRGREDDELISLDDETGMATRVGPKRRCTILMQSTDAKRRKI